MDSPNRIANMKSGTYETIGTALLSPIRPCAHPYWKIAVSTP